MPPNDRRSGPRTRPSAPDGARNEAPGDAVSLARALSKLGVCSRRDAERLVAEGRVQVGGRPARDPAARVDPRRDHIAVDGARVRPAAAVYLALHKPRGVVTTRARERGAPNVYDLLPAALAARHVAAVGRLDKASEGLLLLTNDTRWAARVLDPASHVPKRYHVHVRPAPDDALLAAVRRGVAGEPGEWLAAAEASVLRGAAQPGARTGWLELVLHEGRNRHIRRLLAALGSDVERLIRVAVGPLALGDLAPGAVRALTPAERDALAAGARGGHSPRLSTRAARPAASDFRDVVARGDDDVRRRRADVPGRATPRSHA